MRYVHYFIIFSVTFIVSYLLIPISIRFALRWNIVDKPGERKIHHTPKPVTGGVVIFASFFLVVMGSLLGFFSFYDISWFQRYFPNIAKLYSVLHSTLPKLMLILVGGFFIHLLGFVDDVFKGRMTYRSKFMAQLVIIFFVVMGGVRIEFMPSKALDIIIATVWIVGITNSLNLLDNMDGLAAGVSIICGGLFFCVAVLQGQIFFAFILASLIGACLGFLFYNFYPSKLFMGDSGSLFLGYLFGTLTVTGSYVVESSASLIPVVMPVLILSIPLYDTFSVMFIRWREGRSLFVGDKKHFSHRLVEIGMSRRGAVIFIYLVCFCVGIMATLLPYVSFVGSILILIQAVIIYILITILIVVGRQNKNAAANEKISGSK